MVLPALCCGILVHSHDASKADHFGLLGAGCIQGVSGQVPLAPIGRKRSTPSPLHGQPIQISLVQVWQHLNVWDLAQLVLDRLQACHLVATMHSDISIQVG